MRLLLIMIGGLLLCGLAGCGPDSPREVARLAPSPSPAGPTVTPDLPGMPKPVRTADYVPEAVASVGPTLPPATAHAAATVAAASTVQASSAHATASAAQSATDVVQAATRAVQATEQAHTQATLVITKRATASVVAQERSAQETAQVVAVHVTQTAYTAQSGALTPASSGEYGGAGLYAMVLTDSVHLHFRCDKGDTFVPLLLDANGAFDVPGIYNLYEIAGPGETFPAHFTGYIRGAQLTVTASWGAEGQVNARGPFTATVATQPTLLGGCPICKNPGDRHLFWRGSPLDLPPAQEPPAP